MSLRKLGRTNDMHGNRKKYSPVPNELLDAAAPTIPGLAATNDAKMSVHASC